MAEQADGPVQGTSERALTEDEAIRALFDPPF